ncbi:MAG: Crp/Fnr family transcriptional regulator [Rickettsiales bacterium]|nr:Crp/Fnr family transcriptional regulator [Rickettsiales bacterium]
MTALATEISVETPNKLQAFLERSGLFKNIAPETVGLFVQQASIRSFSKGQMIFAQGGEASSFYLVMHGWVKLFRETLDGEEAVIDVLTTNHLFGETALFEEDTYNLHAEVVEEVDVICLPLSLLKNTITKDAQLAMNMLGAMSRFRKQQDMELEHRTVQNAPQRIGCFLLRLCKPDAVTPIRLNLPYDKTLLASRLGMKPETFSRALARLRDETGIRIKGATVEIDTIKQLSSYSCSACSSAYPCTDLH